MITVFLSILALGVLVFIHELGHYLMAKRVGMRVEAFSVGFGKPIYQFKRNGVEWKICILPFGGYVKIAGMYKEKGIEPHDVPDGYFGKRPIDRMKVAFAGPLFNIILALIAFGVLWIAGGQEKQMSQFTNRIGYVDPNSTLYKYGVRAGDEIVKYAGYDYQNYQDTILPSLSKKETIPISVNKIDYYQNKQEKRSYAPYTYQPNNELPLHTIGVEAPAGYVLFNQDTALKTPILDSGIKKGDRIVWVNGELIFSHQQLNSLINEPTTFLTVERNGYIFHTRAPVLPIKEYKLSKQEKNELDDWAYEASIKEELSFLPYVINTDNMIEYPLSFIDPLLEETLIDDSNRNPFFIPLDTNDKILAVNGTPVTTSYDLLNELQTKKAMIVVERSAKLSQPLLWKNVNQSFTTDLNYKDLQEVISTIGINSTSSQKGDLHLLKSIEPVTRSSLSEEAKSLPNGDQLVLGMLQSDKLVIYNPSPIFLFQDSFQNIFKFLGGLFSGTIAPKYVSGPVGIIQAIHVSTSGATEAIFWFGFISLNLAVINLLPIPVLDGGYIALSFFEMVTRRKIKPKTLEKLILPFMVLLMGFLVYVTYQDIIRIVKQFF